MIKTYIEDRPWGSFERFADNEQVTVKILNVNPNQALSLQYHNHRSEFWKVIYGSGKITVGDRVFNAKENDQFFINKGQKHRIETEKDLIKILEISLGQFDENDIVRLQDKYSRDA